MVQFTEYSIATQSARTSSDDDFAATTQLTCLHGMAWHGIIDSNLVNEAGGGIAGIFRLCEVALMGLYKDRD